MHLIVQNGSLLNLFIAHLSSNSEEMTRYKYVGSKDHLSLIGLELNGHCIRSLADIEEWVRLSGERPDKYSEVTATFVINTEGDLLINGRHSEHVVCANGEDVFSAGEITFLFSADRFIKVSRITNQSTGYCPSPESWPVVQIALINIGIEHPEFFTTAFVFRVCDECGWTNVIKDDYYVCANSSCLNDLPRFEG